MRSGAVDQEAPTLGQPTTSGEASDGSFDNSAHTALSAAKIRLPYVSTGSPPAIVGAMAVRPCSGAMMLLAIAWSMGLVTAGAAGALAMGLGTAAFTVMVAVLAVTGRETARAWLDGSRTGGRPLAALQIGAGVLLALSSATLLVTSLPA